MPPLSFLRCKWPAHRNGGALARASPCAQCPGVYKRAEVFVHHIICFCMAPRGPGTPETTLVGGTRMATDQATVARHDITIPCHGTNKVRL